MYDPTVGEFIQEDPIGFKAGDTNLMRYVFNQPTRWTDPSGEGVTFTNRVETNDQIQFWHAALDLYTGGGQLGKAIITAMIVQKNTIVDMAPDLDPESTLRKSFDVSQPRVQLNNGPGFLPPRFTNNPPTELSALFTQQNNRWVPGEHAAAVVLAHELGHALIGLLDPIVFPGETFKYGGKKGDAYKENCPGVQQRGGVVTLVENVVRKEFGLALRTIYTYVDRRAPVVPRALVPAYQRAGSPGSMPRPHATPIPGKSACDKKDIDNFLKFQNAIANAKAQYAVLAKRNDWPADVEGFIKGRLAELGEKPPTVGMGF